MEICDLNAYGASKGDYVVVIAETLGHDIIITTD